MLTREEAESLEIGDLVETTAVFPALSGEPVVLRTAAKSAEKLEFVVTYFGVTLGRWICRKEEGGLKWTFG